MYIKKYFDTLGLPKLLSLPWMVVFVVLGITPAADAGPSAEQLLLNFYTSTGHERLNGTAKLAIETYSPVLEEKQLIPPGYPDDKKQKALQYYRDYYDVNLGSRGISEHKYSAQIVYYNGESKRKDIKDLPDKASFEEFTQQSDWEAGFDRHYDTHRENHRQDR